MNSQLRFSIFFFFNSSNAPIPYTRELRKTMLEFRMCNVRTMYNNLYRKTIASQQLRVHRSKTDK